VKDLFVIGDNYQVKLDTWMALEKPFHTLMKRDRDKRTSGRPKGGSIAEFTYIYHMYSIRSVYENFSPEERKKQAKIQAGLEEDWEPDDKVQEAIDHFALLQSRISPIIGIASKAKKSLHQLEKYLDNVDLEVPDALKEYLDAMTKLPKLMDTVDNLEKKVKECLNVNDGIRGNAEKGHDEDPDID
jgi:exonuclease VII small subunit